MNLQRNNTTIRQVQEQYMEGEVNLWTLGSLTTTLGMES